MNIESSLEFFAMVRSSEENLLIMRTAGYYDEKGSDIKYSAVTDMGNGKSEYRLKPMVEGKPYGQWIGLDDRGRNSVLQWYANAPKLCLGEKVGLGPKPDDVFQPIDDTLDSHFEVGMEVLVKIKKDWIKSTILNVGPEGITVSYRSGNKFEMKTISRSKASERINCVVNHGIQNSETQAEEGVAIPYSRIKTWFDNIVQPEDFTCCQEVVDRVSFKIEENFAIKMQRQKSDTRCYTGKVGHLCNQTFHIQDFSHGKIWIEYDLGDFFTWDFNLTNVEHEIKTSHSGKKSIWFQVTHVWIDLTEYAMEFFNENTMVCRKQIILPFFMSKWLIDNAIHLALGSILAIGKDA